jgi:hypothetical protein
MRHPPLNQIINHRSNNWQRNQPKNIRNGPVDPFGKINPKARKVIENVER